ncbi:MAG: alpha-amylase family glycosyl hydrolase [Treponema sp.]
MKKKLLEKLEQTVPAGDVRLGALYDSAAKNCRFMLWAPTSREVRVNLYKNAEDGQAAFTVPLTYDEKTGVWHGVFAEQDPELFFYDYTVTNQLGTQTVLDPYAVSMAAYTGTGGIGRGAIVDLDKASLKPQRQYPFVPLKKREDAIIYEVSVRDFTVSPDSGVKNIPGTYKAFIEKIPYLQQLGVTHIQLMPVLNFYYTDETLREYEDAGTVHGNNYNWGYDPHNYFTPEGWYASDPHNPEARILELRELINECHKAGIGVLLDVVYNHMAKTDFLEHIVPGYYFRTGKNGNFTSASGCGNDVASERLMVRKLIVDSAVHWVREYGADGFRFDLMGLLDTETVLQAYQRCKALNPSVLFIGEGWKMYNGAKDTVGMDQRCMTETDSVAVFNDEFRDLLKAGGVNEEGCGFLTKKGIEVQQLFSNCIGFPRQNYTADSPGDSVQYLVCHDGLTLHDSIAHNTGLDETKPADKKELIARIKIGNVFALTSQGIAFLHAGQERGRTKPNFCGAVDECTGAFVRNSYDSSDSINRFVWTLDEDYRGLFEYTRGLIHLRKTFDVFRIGNAERILRTATFIPAYTGESLAFGYTLEWTDGRWFLLFNAAETEAVFILDYALTQPAVFVDGESVNPCGIGTVSGIAFEKNRVVLNPCTAAVFRSE